MATRTRYRRSSRTGIAFGGAFWRFEPASRTMGEGGAGQGGGRSGFEPPLPRAFAPPTGGPPSNPGAPYSAMQGLLGMGGTLLGTTMSGLQVVDRNGVRYYFDSRGNPILDQSGQPLATDSQGNRLDPNTGQPITASPTAAPTAGPTATPTAGAPAGGGTAVTQGGASRVGTTVNGRRADGSAITGTITGTDANGNVIIQWEDGAVSTYSSSGQLVSSTPAPGTQPSGVSATQAVQSAAAGGTVIGGGDMPPTVADTSALFGPPPDSYVAPTGPTAVIDPGMTTAPTTTPPDALAPITVQDLATPTTAPTSPYAPPPLDPLAPLGPVGPTTLDTAQMLAPTDTLAPPTYPSTSTGATIDPGVTATPGVTDYVPFDPLAPLGPTGPTTDPLAPPTYDATMISAF